MSVETAYKTVGDYQLASVIGRGQFGVVYKAWRAEKQYIPYAVKCIPKSAVRVNPYVESLFKTEVGVMASLNCPHIMKLFELIETTNNFYLVLQFCNGGDLEKALLKAGRFSEAKSLEYLGQLRQAFERLRDLKVMHRDVKLANIFLHNDQVVLGDFGFAKQGVEMTHTKLGTPITMAPEMLAAVGAYTSKADIWSLGIVFYQMLFGKIPFDVVNFDDLKAKVLTQSGSNLRFPGDVQISAEAKALLRDMLQPDPALRIEWASFFRHPIFASSYTRAQHNSMEVVFPQAQSMTQIDRFPAADPEGGFVQANLDFMLQKSDRQSLEPLLQFFEHRRKVIVFVMFTVRKLRNVSKARSQIGSAGNRLMLAAMTCLAKGMMLADEVLRCFHYSLNLFGLDNFDRFTGTREFYNVEKSFHEDKSVYNQLLEQMRSRFEEEVADPRVRAEWQRYADAQLDLSRLDSRIGELFLELKRLANSQLIPAYRDELLIALLLLYYVANSEQVFESKSASKFDWAAFEKSLSVSSAVAILHSVY